jgi:hypothetical protein
MRVYLSVDERIVHAAKPLLRKAFERGVVKTENIHEFASDAVLGRVAWLEYVLGERGAAVAELMERLGKPAVATCVDDEVVDLREVAEGQEGVE